MEGNLQHAKENVFFIVWMSKVLGSCPHAQDMLNTCISYSSAIGSVCPCPWSWSCSLSSSPAAGGPGMSCRGGCCRPVEVPWAEGSALQEDPKQRLALYPAGTLQPAQALQKFAIAWLGQWVLSMAAMHLRSFGAVG